MVQNGTSDKDMTLELVQVLFRHGERTPAKKELDAFRIADVSQYEPYGFEQLTNNGRNQAYSLGCSLRKSYDDFLDARYRPGDIYAYSSDSDRTKMSLQLVLAGLYPPTAELMWNEKLPWIPIPFDCTPSILDLLLSLEKNPKYLMVFHAINHSAKFKRVMEDYTEFFDCMRVEAGLDIKKNVVGMIQAFNVLTINEKLNIPLPDWYTSEVRKNCSKVFVTLLNVALDSMTKHCGGPMIKQFLQNMNEAACGGGRKMYLYSAHDLNIMAVLKGLGFKNVERPDVSSALIVEKYRDSAGRVYVKLHFWDTIKGTAKTLKLDGQDELCPIEDFVKLAESSIPTDEELNELLSDIDCAKLKSLSLRDHSVASHG